eukprot:TRINITY_DN2910_c0_g2_i2.p1 TRINITY_DN2910_c0_g2~~TRINITY_DN2910_c0_g2_i2.p1  ORF type:complete len:381 (+),score=86.40 TRINITY_DN2910_c0_g2_i2:145-1287(+)
MCIRDRYGNTGLNMVEQRAMPEQSERFCGHLQDVHTVCADEHFVASGSRDTSARLYDRATGKFLRGFGRPVKRGDLQHIKGRDVPPVLGNANPENGGHSADVNAVCMWPDKGLLYTGADCLGTQDSVKAWDMRSGAQVADLKGHTEGVFALALCTTRGLLFSGSTDRTIRVWDTNTNQCVQVLEGHADKVRCLHWDEDHQLLLSGAHDNEVFAWSPEDWTVQFKLTGHKDWVTSITASSEHIATTSVDKTTRIWGFDGVLLQTLTHQNWAASCCFFQDLLVTALGDATLAAHSLSGTPLWCIPACMEHNAVSTVLAAGDTLLSSSWDGTVREWSVEQLEAAAAEAGLCEVKGSGVELEEGATEEEEDVLNGDIFGADDVQ